MWIPICFHVVNCNLRFLLKNTYCILNYLTICGQQRFGSISSYFACDFVQAFRRSPAYGLYSLGANAPIPKKYQTELNFGNFKVKQKCHWCKQHIKIKILSIFVIHKQIICISFEFLWIADRKRAPCFFYNPFL